MRRHLTLLAALALAVSMGCAKGAPHKLGAAGPPPGRIIPVGYDPSVSGLSGAVGEVVYVSGGTAAWVRNGTANTAWVAFPVSGGSTYTPGTGIGIDGGVISNTAPASSDEIFQKPNSTPAPFTILERKSDWIDNTAGNETAYYNVIVPIAGVPITLAIASANLSGSIKVLTNSATPTIAWPKRSDWLQIKLGVDASKVLVTGLDLVNDGCLRVDGKIIYVGGAGPLVMSLNDTDSTGIVRGFYINGTGGGPLYDGPDKLVLSDVNDTTYDTDDLLCDEGAGNSKLFNSHIVFAIGGNNYPEWHQGHSTLTANVTSVSFGGSANMTAGTVFNLRRTRPSAL